MRQRHSTAYVGPRGRGLWNAAIQAYLTAVVMNLKRLAAFLRALRCELIRETMLRSPLPAAALANCEESAVNRCLSPLTTRR